MTPLRTRLLYDGDAGAAGDQVQVAIEGDVAEGAAAGGAGEGSTGGDRRVVEGAATEGEPLAAVSAPLTMRWR